jgi:uncharacterized protein YndB with AHSA1/START domain
MTYIYSITTIHKPIKQVFDFVTTPDNWPAWHPSSLKVSGAIDHALVIGEQVTEEFLVAGRHGYVVWTVQERQPPYRWSIEGRITGSSDGGIVAYTLTPHSDGTTFEREFTYSFTSPLLRLIDWFIIRHRVQAESDEALRRLRKVLEQEQMPAFWTAQR